MLLVLGSYACDDDQNNRENLTVYQISVFVYGKLCQPVVKVEKRLPSEASV